MPALEHLYADVTEAIGKAELLEDSGATMAAAWAYFRVSTLEQAIADALDPDDEEGAAARRGAVTAALRAGLYVVARDLAERYLAEPNAPAHLREDMQPLLEQASRRVPIGPTLVYSAATFRLRDFP